MKQTKRSAFVTGATGFVGSHLVDSLLREGWQVTVLARRPEKVRSLGDVAVARGDLADADALRAALPGDVDVVFHVAANIDFNDRANQWRDNVQGTDNLLEAALARRARRFVFTSTSAVWGIDHDRFDENSPRRGARAGIPYIASKLAAEERVQRAVQRGLHAVILNPGHVVGRSQGQGWDQLFAGLQTGRLTVVPPGIASWCAVDALVRAQIAASERGRSGANYLIGGCDASYHEFAVEAANQLAVRAPRQAAAWLVRAAAYIDELRLRWGGRAPELPRDLARIMCGRLLFSSARAEAELGYVGRDLTSMIRGALPDALRPPDRA